MKITTQKINLSAFVASSRGISIGWALLGLGMIASAALLISTILVWQNSSRVRNDRRIAIQNSLLATGAAIRAATFSNVVELCQTKKPASASNDWVSTSKCFAPAGSNTFNPDFTQAEAGPSTNSNEPKVVDVRLNFEGIPDANGKTCVYIKSCNEKVPNQFIEVILVGAWEDPDPNRPGFLNRTELVVERAR